MDEVNGSNPAIGIDLTEYYLNVEWDVMHVNALRRSQAYDCCSEPFIDIIFNITVRRKTLFYTINMIVPCVAISCLSILVFYLPSDSGEKVTLSISLAQAGHLKYQLITKKNTFFPFLSRSP